MNLLFVKSDKIGSRLLRWGLDEDVSHVIIEFNGKYHQYFHAYGMRLQPLSDKEFAAIGYEVVYKIELYLPYEEECVAQDMYYKDSKYQLYDYPSFVYFGWRAALKKFFDTPYPIRNSANERDKTLCTEALYLAAEIYADITGHIILPTGMDLAITTPKSSYLQISEHVKGLAL